MDVNDAFSPPNSNVTETNRHSNNAANLSDAVIGQLQKTRPWVLFLAVLGFITATFVGLAALGMIFGAVFSMTGRGGAGAMAGITGIALVYIASAVVYFMAALYLYRYASAIQRVTRMLDMTSLELALRHQASFWKLMGIVALVSIVLMVLLILGFVIFGMSAASFL